MLNSPTPRLPLSVQKQTNNEFFRGSFAHSFSLQVTPAQEKLGEDGPEEKGGLDVDHRRGEGAGGSLLPMMSEGAMPLQLAPSPSPDAPQLCQPLLGRWHPARRRVEPKSHKGCSRHCHPRPCPYRPETFPVWGAGPRTPSETFREQPSDVLGSQSGTHPTLPPSKPSPGPAGRLFCGR